MNKIRYYKTKNFVNSESLIAVWVVKKCYDGTDMWAGWGKQEVHT